MKIQNTKYVTLLNEEPHYILSLLKYVSSQNMDDIPQHFGKQSQ